VQELLLLFIFIGIPLAIAAGFYAGRLGRNPLMWTMVGILLSPIVAFVFLFALGEKSGADDDEAEDRMACPFCAEEIKIAAIICPHCRSDLESPQALRAIQRRLQKESESESV
jgi:hypothetical protein